MANFYQITRTEFTVAQYIGWMRSGELELNPHFQRRSVWKAPAKSYFLDTVSRGLPIPIVFLRERTDLNTLKTIREVVDGQQRLRTLFTFIAPDLLSDYDEERDFFTIKTIHNKEFGGKRFAELPTIVREHLISYQISTHVLPSSTSDAEVLDMFRRMNATGTKLNDQELRNAEYFGVFSQVARNLAQSYLSTWREWRIFNDTDFSRMREVEFTSELLILTEFGIQEKTQRGIENYYKRFDEEYPRSQEIITVVMDIMDIISRELSELIWRTPYANTAIFYSLFAALLDLRYGPVISRQEGPLEPRDLPPHTGDAIRGLAAQLRSREKMPANVIEALNSRSNRASNRRAIRDFIVRAVNEPAA